MCRKPGFLSAFEYFWNSWGSAQNNLVFIVCGSATSWLVDNVEKNKGGLFNRLTCRLYLTPFNLQETEEYLKFKKIDWPQYTISECYMIMGGIPYYLSLLDSNLSYNNNIDNIFFKKNAELFDEFDNLYNTLFSNSENHIKIVEALSSKRGGMSRTEIINKTKIPDNGVLSKMLNNLEYAGFIRILNSFKNNKNNKIYQLSDYYTAFYFKFLKNHSGIDEHYWSNTLDNPSRKAWAGLTFEQLCFDHIKQIKRKLGISGVLTEISTWNYKGDEYEDGAQIDLIITRRDQVINLCEIKFSRDEYTINKEYNLRLHNKVETFRRVTNTKYALHLTMITTYGVKKNAYGNEINFEVTLDDLFKDIY